MNGPVKKREFAPVLLAFALGCTKTTNVAGPDGKEAIAIECVNTSVEDCYAQAQAACPGGYTLLNAEKTSTSGSTGAGFSERELLIQCQDASEEAAPTASGSAPPKGAFGYLFGATLDDARAACEGHGHAFTPGTDSATCSGLPPGLPFPGSIRFGFSSATLQQITLTTAIGGITDDEIFDAFEELVAKVAARYGPPSQRSRPVPMVCSRGRLRTCLENGQTSLTTSWSWSRGHAIGVTTRNSASAIYFDVTYGSPDSARPSEVDGF